MIIIGKNYCANYHHTSRVEFRQADLGRRLRREKDTPDQSDSRELPIKRKYSGIRVLSIFVRVAPTGDRN